MDKIVKKLKDYIEKKYGWVAEFNKAICKAQSYDLYDFPELQEWNDYTCYLKWIDENLKWIPRQEGDTRYVYDHIVKFYFILDQEPVKSLQTPIKPGEEKLEPLSEWIVEYANAWGLFMDTPESAERVKSFKYDQAFHWDDYMPPPSNYKGDDDYKAYRTFNQFFARHVKPGVRPIAGLRDNSVIVSPADCTFAGWWQIGNDEDSNIYVVGEKNGVVDIKGIQWSIRELLKDSKYADRFKGGIFCHMFLNSIDYHRWHTPVQGKVVEARVIQGQCYLDVNVAQKRLPDGTVVNVLNALDGTGYQFVQTRGLIVIDSPIGLVACLPMGMAQVSSVVITAEEGGTLQKGEELGYFQFGGSDWVIVFERASNVQLIAQPNVHYNQGTWLGNAYPYTMR